MLNKAGFVEKMWLFVWVNVTSTESNDAGYQTSNCKYKHQNHSNIFYLGVSEFHGFSRSFPRTKNSFQGQRTKDKTPFNGYVAATKKNLPKFAQKCVTKLMSPFFQGRCSNSRDFPVGMSPVNKTGSHLLFCIGQGHFN